MQTKEISNTFYVLRFFGLLAIVLAHSTFQQISNELVVKSLHAFGRSGVIIFFIASGYYFDKTKYNNVYKMLKPKIATIIIPWLIWGTAAYCIRFVKEPFYFNPIEIIAWDLGYGTYLWFLTLLIVMYIIFQILPNNKFILFGAIFITIVSTFLTVNNIGLFSILKINEISGLGITIYFDTYLNVLNWCGFFAGGILLKKSNLILKYAHMFLSNKKWFTLFLLPILYIMIITEKEASYWTYYSIFIELIIFIMMLTISSNINQVKILQRIGTITFPIYLLHMQIQGFIFNKLFPQSILMGILRPFFTIISIYVLLQFGLYISKKIHMEKFYKVVFGLRQ